MKRLIAGFALFVFSATAWAGATYDFHSVTEGGRKVEMKGKASAEGLNWRLDFVKGDGMIFQDDGVALSNDGGKTITLIDNKKKTYSELAVEDLLGLLGSVSGMTGGMVKIEFANFKTSSTPGGDGGTIEGFATKKHLINSSYDLIVTVMGFKNESHVESKTEAWASDKLGRELTTVLQARGFKTGNAEFDAMLEEQAGAMKGFPLKQVITTTTTSKKGKPSVTTTTLTASNVKQESVPASMFKVPSGYEKKELLDMEALGQPKP